MSDLTPHYLQLMSAEKLGLVFIMFILSFAAIGCSARQQEESFGLSSSNSDTEAIMPKQDVLIWIESNKLFVANNSEDIVYFEAFPNEVLSVIEWGPCDDPESCKNKALLPGEEKSLSINRIVNRDTTGITVVCWNLEESESESRYEVTNQNSASFDITR